MIIYLMDVYSNSIVSGLVPQMTWQIKIVCYTCNLCVAGVKIKK